MNQEIIRWLASDSGVVVHTAVLVTLLLGGLGLPFPEDLPLILAGVASSKNIVSLKGIFVTCYVGVMVGDQMMFFFGHYFGQRLLTASTKSTFLPYITQEKVDEVREGLRKRRLLFIFIGRHLFPIRSVTFITAGALRIPFLEFLLADAIAALASVSLTVGLGYFLGHNLTPQTIDHLTRRAHFYILGFLALIFLIYVIYNARRKRDRGNENETLAQKEGKDFDG